MIIYLVWGPGEINKIETGSNVLKLTNPFRCGLNHMLMNILCLRSLYACVI